MSFYCDTPHIYLLLLRSLNLYPFFRVVPYVMYIVNKNKPYLFVCFKFFVFKKTTQSLFPSVSSYILSDYIFLLFLLSALLHFFVVVLYPLYKNFLHIVCRYNISSNPNFSIFFMFFFFCILFVTVFVFFLRFLFSLDIFLSLHSLSSCPVSLRF